MTTYEIAKQCVECHQPAEFESKLWSEEHQLWTEFFKCKNERCEGFGGIHPVSVNKDGTMPVIIREKMYPRIDSAAFRDRSRRNEEQIYREMEAFSKD